MRSVNISAALLAALAAAWPVAPNAAEVTDLKSCRAALKADLRKGREQAAQWAALGGGAEAELCEGEALVLSGALLAAAKKLMVAGASGATLSTADRVAALITAGAIWTSRSRDDLAKKSFELVLKLDPGSRPARLGLARLAAARGDYKAAEAELSKHLATGAEDTEAYTLRAAARRKLKRVKEAKADAARAVKIAPTNAIGWFELGAAEKALGDAKAARAAWVKAAQLDPTGPGGALATRALQLMDGG